MGLEGGELGREKEEGLVVNRGEGEVLGLR